MRAIVIGAGPAGATAALELARAGAEVHLVEKSAWPRVKTCGDGISPLGINEGRKMNLAIEGALRLRRALVTTPGGTAFHGGWPAGTPWGTTIARREFDASLVDAAVAAGTRFLDSTNVRDLRPGTNGINATIRNGSAERELRGDVAIVAEGATGGLAGACGFPSFRSRLVALRGYVETPHDLASEYGLFYDRVVTPGYGWIFPMDDRRANVGILVDERTLARRGGNMRTLLTRWLFESRYARELLGERPEVSDLRGGVIPSGRRKRSSGRVFLVGDAAGVADPFTAEGIFQAMLSARLAARSLIACTDYQAASARYERELRIFDRNERAARGLRATFNAAIEPYARHAARRPAFADRLNTDVFFLKKSLAHFVYGLARAW